MGIARKLQSVVSSTSLIMYRSLLGLKTELNKCENEIWEVSRVITQNQYPLDQVRCYMSFYEPHSTPDGMDHLSPTSKILTILLSILEASHFPLSISKISETHILLILIEIFY